ncbi:MAG: WYL domain-containing protein [Eubacterium sp.]|nr:WYL domain-containing protein [Eubacterium sp.]
MADMQNVTLMCRKDYESYITERFGSDIEKNEVDDEHFEVTVEVDMDPVFIGWVAGLVGGIRALGPGKLVDRLRDIAAELDSVYGRDKTGREHLM